MINFSFNLKGKKITIPVLEYRSIFSQMRGLMFSKKTDALLFVFKKKTRQSIHSFFCREFIGIWINGGKIIDVKRVTPWKVSIVPKEEFDKLLEIPVGNPAYKIILDGMGKI